MDIKSAGGNDGPAKQIELAGNLLAKIRDYRNTDDAIEAANRESEAIRLAGLSRDLIRKRDDLEKILKYCEKYGIEIAIDLLTGYPNESIQSTENVIRFFKENRPKTVGINFYYRLFKNTRITRLIEENPILQEQLTRPYAKEENYLEPIFYSQYEKEDIEKLISDDNLFKIPGIIPGVNYQQK